MQNIHVTACVHLVDIRLGSLPNTMFTVRGHPWEKPLAPGHAHLAPIESSDVWERLFAGVWFVKAELLVTPGLTNGNAEWRSV